MEIRKIQKSGNSLYVTLPRSYLSALGLVSGDYALLILIDGKIQLAPVKKSFLEEGECKKKKSKKSRLT